jgi:hypothetical protein
VQIQADAVETLLSGAIPRRLPWCGRLLGKTKETCAKYR